MQTETSFDLVELGRLLWRRKALLLASGLTLAVAAFATSLALPKRYAAMGSLLVRSEALTSPDTEAAFYAAGINEAVVTTEQDVLTSPGLLRRAAGMLDLTAAMTEPASLGQRLTDALDDGAWAIGGPRLQQRLDTQMEALFPSTPSTPDSAAEAQTRFLASAMTIATTKSSSVIGLTATTKDPQLSAGIVNTVMDLYLKDRLAEQTRTAKTIEAALRERLRQTQAQITAGEDQLVRLLKEPGAIETSEVPGLMQDMSLLGSQLTQAQADLARRKAEYAVAIHTREHGGAATAPDSISNNISGDLRRQLAGLQTEMARLSSDYLPEAPARRATQQQIATVQASIAAEASRGIEQRRSELAAAQATADSLQQQVDAMRTRRQSQSSSSIDVDRQKQAVASLWKISDALETRLIDLAARPVNPNAQILSMANPPVRAAFPSKGLFTAAGFILGVAGAAATTLMLTHVRRLRALPLPLAQQLGAPLLGGLPEVAGLAGGQRRLLRSAISRDGDALAATLRAVALEVEDTILGDQIACLMVTSGKPGEGKTTVALALGRSLAAMPMRVLLVDLDLRRPSAERLLAASATDRLEEREQRVGPMTVLRVKCDRQSGLHVLTPCPGGFDDPISFLRATPLREIITLARSSYDLILFDTPPVMSVPDALEVARLADAILLVTEAGRNEEAERVELSRRLTRTRKPICGVVATKIAGADMSSAGYSGYGRLRLTGRRESAAPVSDIAFVPAGQS